jgi:hypothetical protein
MTDNTVTVPYGDYLAVWTCLCFSALDTSRIAQSHENG